MQWGICRPEAAARRGRSSTRKSADFTIISISSTIHSGVALSWWTNLGCVIARVLAATFLWPTLGVAQETVSTPPTQVHQHVDVTASLLTPTKEASGTAWLPADTPMYGTHRPWRGWDL